MRKRYTYDRCSKCKSNKEENRSPYCKECTNSYGKQYRYIKKAKPNVNLDGLGSFLKKLERNRYYFDFYDLNVILFFYEIITEDINEYDNLTTGQQIICMYNKICSYYNKKTDKQKKYITL